MFNYGLTNNYNRYNNLPMVKCPINQRRSCIYAVTQWRAHQQVKYNWGNKKKKKNCIATFYSLIKSV